MNENIIREGEVRAVIDGSREVDMMGVSEEFSTSISFKMVTETALRLLFSSDNADDYKGDEITIKMKRGGVVEEELFKRPRGFNLRGEYYLSRTGDLFSLRMKSFRKKQDRDKFFRMDGTVRVGSHLRPEHYRLPVVGRRGLTKVFISHLVAYTFIGPRPESIDGNKNVVINHIDNNLYNNSVDNLEYITQEENVRHGNGTKIKGEVLLDVLDSIRDGVRKVDIAKEIGVNVSSIYYVMKVHEDKLEELL